MMIDDDDADGRWQMADVTTHQSFCSSFLLLFCHKESEAFRQNNNLSSIALHAYHMDSIPYHTTIPTIVGRTSKALLRDHGFGEEENLYVDPLLFFGRQREQVTEMKEIDLQMQ